MKFIISLTCLFATLTTNADVRGLRCDIVGMNQALLTQERRSFNIPNDAGVRKISYMVSENTPDGSGTYNTTVNLLVKADDSGLKVVSVKAWPDGGASVRRANATDISISFPSRLDKHEVETKINCDKFNADYLLVSNFSFKDEDYLNVPSLALESFFELASNDSPTAYARAVANVNSHSQFAAKEFCFMGDVEKLMSDLKRSVATQIHDDENPNTYPNYWERSGYNQKTLAPLNLVYTPAQKLISWTQPREAQVCTHSHHETVNNSDTGQDEDVEVCDSWAPQKLNDLFNQLKICDF